jgi:Zn-dependent M28 family amino/carboxypeptidase
MIAKVTGSKYPDEYIIFIQLTGTTWILVLLTKLRTVHSNGDLDNATGTTGLLELARTFKHSDQKSDRSLIYSAVTAEEQEFLSSAYDSSYTVYAANKTLANINMNGLNYYGKTKIIIVVG